MSGHRRSHRREEPKDTNNGLNLNNLDLSSIAGLLNKIDLNQVTGLINSLSQNNGSGESNAASGSSNVGPEASLRRNEIVKAINTLINADRSEVLQVLIQLYSANRTIKK